MARKKELAAKPEAFKPASPRRWKDLQVKPEAPAASAPRRWLLLAVAPALIVAAFLGGLIALGKWGLEQIRSNDRYTVLFAEIDCAPPPGLTRAEFLDEVQYESRLADRLGLLDDDLTQRLTTAFTRHPWVERVDGVVLQQPPHVRVRLVFRKPVLAVPTGDGLIAVDRLGVRMPKTAATEGLPVFEGNACPPQGPAGTKWGDPGVEERARQVKK